VADAYVRDGSYAATNYGTAKNLVVKYSSTSGQNRQTYLRFDLHAVTGTIISAKLRLYGQHVATGPWSGADGAYPVANNTWIESGTGGITWNTRPSAGQPALANTTVGETLQYYSWNIGSYAAAQQAGSKELSLMVAMNALNADGHLENFNSREARSSPPQLVLTIQ
jgi:hypothetical protein